MNNLLVKALLWAAIIGFAGALAPIAAGFGMALFFFAPLLGTALMVAGLVASIYALSKRNGS